MNDEYDSELICEYLGLGSKILATGTLNFHHVSKGNYLEIGDAE